MTLRWINETRLVEAGATRLGLYNREGQLLAYQPEGARLPASIPSADFVRYLAYPTVEREYYTFRDWYWTTGVTLDTGEGSVYTHCCAFDRHGNFAHGGDWEDGGYWRGIDGSGRKITGSAALPILYDMAFAPDGSRLLLGGRRSYFAVWPFSAAAHQADKIFDIPGGIVSAVAWSGSGAYVAALTTLKKVFIWEMQRGSAVANLPTPPGGHWLYRKLRFVPGAEHLIWISTDTCVQLINWRQRLVVHTIPSCQTFDLSPSGEYVAYRREGERAPVILPVRALAGNQQLKE